MTSGLSLSHYLLLRVIPFAVIVLLSAGMVLVDYTQNINRVELEKHHKNIGAAFEDHFNTRINNVISQLKTMASNDLIINAIIDVEERENYIPLYLRSFYLMDEKEMPLALLDYKGRIIAATQRRQVEEKTAALDWTTAVLTEGKLIKQFVDDGLYLIAPVVYAGAPEGAIFAFLERDSYSKLFDLKTSSIASILVNNSGNVIYTTEPYFREEGLWNVSDKTRELWFLSNHGLLADSSLHLITAQKKSIAFLLLEKLYWILTISLIVCVVVIVSIIFIVTRVLNVTLLSLSNTIAKVFDSEQLSKRVKMGTEPEEMQTLASQFNAMMARLEETTTSKLKVTRIFESIEEMFAVTNLNGFIETKNAAMEKFLLKREINIYEQLHIEQVLTDIYSGDRLGRFDADSILLKNYLVKSAEGNRKICVQWRRSSYYGVDGVMSGHIYTGLDYTKMRQAEHDIRIRNRAIEVAGSGISIADASVAGMPIIYVNPAFEKITGYRKDYILGKNYGFLQGPETDRKTIDKIHEALHRHQTLDVEILNYRADGTTFWNKLTLAPMSNEEGFVSHFLGVHVDVTERVINLNKLELAKQEAEVANNIKSEFLANMSHEIRSPMNSVLGMLKLLRTTHLDETQSRYSQVALKSAESLLTIIDDILDFSKMESGKLELECIDFDIHELMENVVESIAYRVNDKSLDCRLWIDTSIPTHIKGDPTRIRQILTNFTSNALKFTDQGSITIKLSLLGCNEQHYLMLFEVEDSGVGIKPEHQHDLFDAFAQADSSTTRKYGGTGLGLSICKNIALIMDGDVGVKSVYGEGSCFWFKCQLAKSELAKASAVENTDFPKKHAAIYLERSFDVKLLKNLLDHLHISVELLDSEQALMNWGNQQQLNKVLFISEERYNAYKKLKAKEVGENVHGKGLMIVCSQHQDSSNHSYDTFIDGVFFKPYRLSTLRNLLHELIYAKKISTAEYVQPKTVSDAKILLVEDSYVNQEVALGMLALYGYRCDIANNGVQALDVLKAAQDTPFELVLMDCQMPEMDGFEATRRIRQGDAGSANQEIPIIAMTANAMQGDKEKCLAAGMTDYLSKPVDNEKLIQKVQAWLVSSVGTAAADNSDLAQAHASKPIWDSGLLDRRLGQNQRLKEKIIALFLEEMPSKLQLMEEAARRKDMQTMAIQCHELKAGCASVGCESIVNLCAMLMGEEQLVDGMADIEIIMEVKLQFNKVIRLLSEYLSSARANKIESTN